MAAFWKGFGKDPAPVVNVTPEDLKALGEKLGALQRTITEYARQRAEDMRTIGTLQSKIEELCGRETLGGVTISVHYAEAGSATRVVNGIAIPPSASDAADGMTNSVDIALDVLRDGDIELSEDVRQKLAKKVMEEGTDIQRNAFLSTVATMKSEEVEVVREYCEDSTNDEVAAIAFHMLVKSEGSLEVEEDVDAFVDVIIAAEEVNCLISLLENKPYDWNEESLEKMASCIADHGTTQQCGKVLRMKQYAWSDDVQEALSEALATA